MQNAMIKTEVVSPCVVAPLPSPGVMGNHGGAQGAGSYQCQAPVMQTYAEGGGNRDVHIQGVTPMILAAVFSQNSISRQKGVFREK